MKITIEVSDTLTFRRHETTCEYLTEKLPAKALLDIFLVGFQRHLDVATAPVNAYFESEKKERPELTLAEATAELADKRWAALVTGTYGTRQGGPRKDPTDAKYLEQAFLFLRARRWKVKDANEACESVETFWSVLLDMTLRLEAGQRGIKTDDLDNDGQKAATDRANAKVDELLAIVEATTKAIAASAMVL